ncbi:unnamed protein product [Heterobilharzia americana]|nr:unnamed protein product [Heterobilharzia americana]
MRDVHHRTYDPIVQTTPLPPSTSSVHSHRRHHEHCAHTRPEVTSDIKMNGISGEKKTKPYTTTSISANVTTTNTSNKEQKPSKSNFEYDMNLIKGRDTLRPSVPPTTVTTTPSTSGTTKQKSLHQPQPSTSMQDKKTKTTTETNQLNRDILPDDREENGEGEMPYPVSVSAPKPGPKLDATPNAKSTQKRQTREQLQHPVPPPYWYYHQNEQQQPQQYQHHHHPACASLIAKHSTSTKLSTDQTQPTIYGSEFLAANYPHISTKVLKPPGSSKSEHRVTSTKKRVTSKSSALLTDQVKSTAQRDYTEDKKESKDKVVKQLKKLRDKPSSDDTETAGVDPNQTFEQLKEDLRSAGFSVDASRSHTIASSINVKEFKKVVDKSQPESRSKRYDITSDQVKPHTEMMTSTSIVTITPTTSHSITSNKPTKSSSMEEPKPVSRKGNMGISDLIPVFDSTPGEPAHNPIYLDSESEEEPITDTKVMKTAKTVEKSSKVESKVCKKQVEEWMEKNQAVYTKEKVAKDTDIQVLQKEDNDPVEINNEVGLHPLKNVGMTSVLPTDHSQTNLSQRSLRSHSPSLPLSCHSIEPGSTDVSLSSNLSTSASSYSMLSGCEYTPSGGCSCERVHKHGCDNYSLSSYSSTSCEYPYHTHRFHHSRPSSFYKHHEYYRYQPCYCHRCTSRSRRGHYKRHASEHHGHKHVTNKHPERHHSHHSEHHRYHSHSRHSSGKHSSHYHIAHHQNHPHHHKSDKLHKDYHSDEFSEDKNVSTSSSSRSMEKISLEESVLLKSNLNYSSSLISDEKLSEVKNSQKELLSSLKSQERRLKQELAKHRALTEKLERIKRYNEKLLNMDKVSLSNPILIATKSSEYHTVFEGDDTTKNTGDDNAIHLEPLGANLNDKIPQSNEEKLKEDKQDGKKIPHRQRHHGTLSRSSSHKKSRSRSGHSSSTSRRRLQTKTKHSQEQKSADKEDIRYLQPKLDGTNKQNQSKETAESVPDGEFTEANVSHKTQGKKDVLDSEKQKHNSKRGTRYGHYHEHHRNRQHSNHRHSNETRTIVNNSSKQREDNQKSSQSDGEKSKNFPKTEQENTGVDEDNLFIITNKGAFTYQDDEQSPSHKQTDIASLPIIPTTSSAPTAESESQNYPLTHAPYSHTPETNIIKCDLEVINEKQDDEQNCLSEDTSKEEQKQSTERKQSSSHYENICLDTIATKQTEKIEPTQPSNEQLVEALPISPTCPPPIPYTILPVSKHNDEPGDMMIKEAMDLLDEAVAETSHLDSDYGKSRLLSSVNQCLEYGSSEQVMLDDDSEYNGTRISDILECQSDCITTADTETHDTSKQTVGESYKIKDSDRPCSPCESTTSASEGSEDIEPFPPPPSAEVLAEENVENKTDVSEEQVKKLSSDDDDITIAESIEKKEPTETGAELSTGTNEANDCKNQI